MLLPLIQTVQTALKSNPILAGGAGMAVMGWGLMQARALPLRAWRVIQDQFSATLTVYTEDSVYRHLNMWLARHPSAVRARRLNVAEVWGRATQDDDFALTPGPGYHLLREGTRFYLLHRVVEEKSSGDNSFSARRKQTLHITTLGRSRAPLTSLLDRVRRVQDDQDTIPVYVWQSYDFGLVERRRKRSMDSIYLDPATKADIVADITTFRASRATYAHRCIPYRRGYLLEGPAGTGKSSLIFALASEFGLPIYIINIAGLENDNELLKAVNQAGAGIVVIEDIDGATAAAADRKAKAKAKSTPTSTSAARSAGVSLSGLLNATDGIGAKDDRLLFMTSNHPETLDPALIRPGRCDRRFHIGYAGETEAALMAQRFFPGEDPATYVAAVAADLPMPAADLQNRLLAFDE